MSKADGKKKDVSRVLRAKDVIPSSKAPGDESGHGAGSDIPEFDLGEQILAEHRRVVAGRRKGPNSRNESSRKDNGGKSGELGHAIGENVLSEEERIIADIVARDIARLCRDGQSRR